MTTEASMEEKKSFKDFFIKKEVCPVCEGKGTVECCNAEGKNCVAIPCSHCGGKGYIAERDNAHVAIAVAVCAVCLAAVLMILF
jgi:DnaJ-class molecular chaperone